MENFEDYELIQRLDMMMAREKMGMIELSEKVGVHVNNLSIMKNGRGKAIRYSTIKKICIVLKCTPGDLFELRKKENISSSPGQ